MKKVNKVQREDVLEIYTDGASQGNPGKGSCAYVFVHNDEIIHKDSFYLGDITNNQAEYTALIKALDKAIEFTRWQVKVFSDSKLLINQMKGDWRVKNSLIKKLYREASSKEFGIQNLEYYHVSRENKYIKVADQLCSDCIEKHSGKINNDN